MNIDDYLESVSLVDCTGCITHTLTLLLDGKVRVNAGAAEAVVDPTTRTALPKVVRLGRGEYTHDQVIDLACELTLGG